MLTPGTLPSRVLAVCLLILVLLAAYRLGVAPLLAAHQDAGEAITRAHAVLERYRQLAAEAPALAERLAEQEERAATATGYIEANSNALAAARVQDRVKEALEAVDGTLRSMQTVQTKKPTDGPRQTALKVSFSANIQDLAAILHQLESGQPYLFVDQLSVRTQRQRRRRNEAEVEPLLDVSLQVYGYFRPASGS